ncbi:GNAT family N-acetyltransferase [Streptomyces sp. NPDC051940]|uniref:GNAT family N-acetyltransferase n=1 Tax=Streptomyces sp. NPDC051940 TaxID=3155675 RepID=UPI0034145D62
MSQEIGIAGRAQVTGLATALARAFVDDPVWSYVFPDEEARRGRILARVFSAQLRYFHLRHGACDYTADGTGRVVAGALWNPPGTWRTSLWDDVVSLPAAVRAAGRHLARGFAVIRAMEKVHPDEPHWYLAVIGTDPDVRGTGHGAALITARLTEADASGLPVYLESSNPSNVPYYERFGFRVTGEVRPGRGAPTLHTMQRPVGG